MEKKSYSKPVLMAERFEPQEFCNSCWEITLHCVGMSGTQGHEISDVYPWGTTNKDPHAVIGNVHYNGHTAHDTPIIEIRIEGDAGFNPDLINTYEIVGGNELHEEVGVGAGHSGQEFFPGYYWFTGNNNIHFAESINYALSQTRPNHS